MGVGAKGGLESGMSRDDGEAGIVLSPFVSEMIITVGTKCGRSIWTCMQQRQ